MPPIQSTITVAINRYRINEWTRTCTLLIISQAWEIHALFRFTFERTMKILRFLLKTVIKVDGKVNIFREIMKPCKKITMALKSLFSQST